MADFLSELRRQQLLLARRIAEALFRELTSLPSQDARLIAMFSPAASLAVNAKSDKNAYAAFLSAELERAVILAVSSISDVIAGKIIHSNDFGVRPFPIPDAIVTAWIAVKVSVMPSVVSYAATHMSQPGTLPLLGKIDDGDLTPDTSALNKWKACFDWHVAPPSLP
jgi:hypothetical protein